MRQLIAFLIPLLLAAQPLPAGGADLYPLLATEVIVPGGELSESAQVLQMLRAAFRKSTGKDMSLDFAPGRAGATAWIRAAANPLDGYHLAGLVMPDFVIRSLAPDAGFSRSDLRGIMFFAKAPLAIFVPDQSPIMNLEDLIRQAGENPERVMISGSGSSSAAELANLRFNRQAGVRTKYMGFMDSAAALDAARRGTALAAWAAGTRSARMDGLRPLALAGAERSRIWPDTPTFTELDRALEEYLYFGLAAPAALPARVLERVTKAVAAAANSPDFTAGLLEAGYSPTPELGTDFSALQTETTAKYRDLMRDYGMPMDRPKLTPPTDSPPQIPDFKLPEAVPGQTKDVH